MALRQSRREQTEWSVAKPLFEHNHRLSA